MTDGDVTKLRYWIDLGIKAIIGVVVSIVGMDYRSVKNSLSELQQAKYAMTTEVSILRVELRELVSRLQRIENKLDKLADK
jgi:predicted nuclease with TOPRIM domain